MEERKEKKMEEVEDEKTKMERYRERWKESKMKKKIEEGKDRVREWKERKEQ